MAESFKDKMEDAGDKIAHAATRVGDRISEGAEEAADWVKEKTGQAGAPLSESTGPVGSTADIREHMDVYASCGTKVGRVDHVEGQMIKLTKSDSPDGMHHLIPMSWVAKVHDHVHLDRDHKAVQSHWQPA
ncbi:MAG TPA: DUF2171 domain-containing protein [Isosphaeraceae bacterium]|nr:DUF2171 domain-containing protein [Isosphaeraceae bacterium]